MNDTTKKSFVLYTSYLEQVNLLSDKQAGVLFKAILQYAQDRTVVEMDDMTSMAFAFIKSQMDNDSKKYEESKRKRVEAGRSGGLAKASKAKQSQAELSKDNESLANQAVYVDVDVNDNVNESEDVNVDGTSSSGVDKSNKERESNIDVTGEKEPKKRFKPPTVEEVAAYCAEKGYKWSPESFWDFYESKGWMVGKNKMVDWKASVRNWNNTEKKKKQNKTSEYIDAINNRVRMVDDF